MRYLLFFILFSLNLTALDNPNVVIILTDDLGWGDVSYHGSHIPTPNIDKLAKIEAWLQKHPHEPVLFSCAAKLYQNEGMFKKAISALDTANGIQPSAELTAQLAQAYLKQGNDSQAIAYYQQTLNDYQSS